MRRLLGGLTAAALLVGGLATAPPAQAVARSAGAPAYAPPPITFGPCTNPTLQRAGAECGLLTVPLDYADPGAAKIKIAVSRIRHSTTPYQGVMLVNPGGPGGSGLIFPVLRRSVPDQAGLSYDWIGFDPRGVGDSQPSLSCDGDYFGYNRPYHVPVNAQLEQSWRTRAAGYAADCAAAGGALLDHMKTTDSVADMESIRIALGESQINYYGFSYGTYLASVYATLHPDLVRRMVFDGNVNPQDVYEKANFNQDLAFDKNIKIYVNWLAKYDSVYHLGNDGAAIEKAYYRVLGQLRTAPGAGGTIGPDEWTDVFTSAGYYVRGWADIASAFSAAVNDNDFSLVKTLYDDANAQGPGADNFYAVMNAVQCTDASWTTNWNAVRNKSWNYYARAPFLTWSNTWYNAPCQTWAAKPGKPVKVDGSKAPGILLISETNDAATPFAGSLVLRRLFPESVLIEGVGGTTHAGSLSGVACTDDRIADYLATGALPDRKPGNGSDVQCDPVPPPDPTEAAGLTASGSGSSRVAPDVTALRMGLTVGTR